MRFTELSQPQVQVVTAKTVTQPTARACWIIMLLLGLGVSWGPRAAGQAADGSRAASAQDEAVIHPEGVATGLGTLLDEANRNNPEILAARHAWKAATLAPSQVSTPPDPQITVQQFAVGSPRPFAGFTNSEFAYLGLGISQDLPYPGKRRLRGEIAQRDAVAEGEQFEAVRRSVLEQLKAAYFKLAYEHQELEILERDGKLLDQIAKIVEARYRVGQGNQQDVLKAQLERTKLLRDETMHHQEHGSLQAQLRQILNRPPGQPDILPQPLTETPLNHSVDELLATARNQNPEVQGQEEMVRRQSLQVELARKDFYPDFNVQYMWQHTAEQFRDYYMLSFGVRIPIYRSRKQRPELAQAAEELNRSRREYEAQVQQAYFDIRDQYLQAETAARILKMYREGLIPQAAGAFKAGIAAYEANRQDFETLLTSFLDLLHLDEEYWRTLLDHETAVARLEQITGMNGDEKRETTK
ncbi:MAG TPA: TolC family protein [Terriglobia bacterium]|nr:TolC family protein [Terriglobia bacterium]